jgi:hypothetical protein
LRLGGDYLVYSRFSVSFVARLLRSVMYNVSGCMINLNVEAWVRLMRGERPQSTLTSPDDAI